MTRWIQIYRAQLKVGIAAMLQYRFAVLIWAVWGFVGPLISLAVWTAATASRGGSISQGATTFSRADFAAYFLVFMVFSHLTMSWDAMEFASRIRDGQLSPQLLKPIHPIHRDVAANLAFKIVTSAMLLPVWGLLILIFKPTPPANLWQPILAVPALLIAGVMRYLFNYCVALIAFWTTRVDAINQLYFTLDSFLSGRIAPLALLPLWLGTIATYSPFRSMISFPVELALGRVPSSQIPLGFALQIFWLSLSVIALRKMWNSGIRQYSAVGA